MMKDLIITKSIDNSNTAVWFSPTNRYLVVNDTVANILIDFNKGISQETIALKLSKEFNESLENSLSFVHDTYSDLYLKNMKHKDIEVKQLPKISNITFESTKYYTIGDFIFKIDYQSDFEIYLIHPKFSHLETKTSNKFDHHYQVFTQNEFTTLVIDNNVIDTWHRKDIHYFQGKLSMYIVQQMHQKNEDEWLGVFHASGVSYNSKSLLLLGDSGNGKSTSLALLQANGLTCLADDFVPVDSKKQHIHTFPSAISIKKNSLPTLLPFYPELENSAEFHFKTLNKIVRFLPPKINDYTKNLPCNHIVFIKYEKESGIKFNPISKLEAFEQLVPDSWISSKPENVRVFLNWFASLECFQLKYSENDKMIATIKKLLSDDV
ncbi:hypothetical protein [Tenacibaculum sp. M341]|uniref:hypothetical protein n=1 Tax=Tenacibaculum sp. M341 TaxID=2530339 RepID=UPI00105123DC|nr:hypothetical protein [Tenacibaculum sp. M341]TCI85344.1 hypothetical protein EYW44_17380 [Tenacibaculum sp. M341]